MIDGLIEKLTDMQLYGGASQSSDICNCLFLSQRRVRLGFILAEFTAVFLFSTASSEAL